MIKRATVLGRNRPFRPAGFPFGRIAVLLGSALVVSVALAGCAGSGKQADAPAAGNKTTSSSAPAPGSTSPGPATGSSDAPCRQWSCTPGQPVRLGDGYSVRLWSSAAPTTALKQPDLSTPVLQLLHEDQHRQWWVGRAGFGWTAKLDCLPAAGKAIAHCAVLAEVGSHAGTAELVLLRSGALDSPAQAGVTFDGGRPLAADFDHDGWLDVLGTENDYQPNYASGRNYWATYRLVDGSLQRTGCLPRRTAAEAPPERLLTGECPVRFPS
ncbi:MAG TPA: hypothetical protein VF557_20655 [Jatrophihabitans sp.]|jgi:hypothetical protein|uniref:hypothetical protein n=1 Tax=Jatrophihabitans sp. TaxID=1932789 RepID=UPI002EE67320